MNTKIYLDNAATTQTDPRVVEAMLPYFSENYGNPSGIHFFCRQAKKALDEARAKVADILHCQFEEVIFTGGGTESDNLAIFGAYQANVSERKNHCLTSAIEHHAVLHAFQRLENVDYLQPNLEGQTTPEQFEQVIQEGTFLASVMYANNEVGTLNDIPVLAEIAQKKGVIFHTDACQAMGAVDIDLQKLPVDLLTLNGSKINGPKGVGALFKRKNVKITPQIVGGAQEFGLRAGTENIAGIVGLAKALEISDAEQKENERVRKLRDRIIDFVLKNIPLSRLNGHRTERLPNNINFSFLNTEGESLLLHLDEAGFAVNTGSACTSESLDPSHVLIGLGLPKEVAHGSLRITLSKFSKEEDIEKFLQVLPQIVEKVRSMSPIHFGREDFPELF